MPMHHFRNRSFGKHPGLTREEIAMKIDTRKSYFMLRKDGTSELPDFPLGAEMAYKDTIALVIAGENGTSNRKLVGHTFDEAIRVASDEISCRGAKGVRIGRAIGTFGRPNVYQETAVLTGDDFSSDLFVIPSLQKDIGEKQYGQSIVGITKQTGGGRFIEGMASTEAVDRDDDIVLPGSLDESLPDYRNNPVLLFNHDFNRPVGNVVEIKSVDNGYFVRARVDDPEAKRWVQLGNIRAFSIHFLMKDFEFKDMGGGVTVRIVKTGELIETSIVTVQSNRGALFEVVKSFGGSKASTFIQGVRKSAPALSCSVKTPGLVQARRYPFGESVSLSPDSIQKAYGSDAARLSAAFEVDDSLIYVHHGLDEDGAMKTSETAVRVGLARLIAGDEPRLNEESRKGVWGHLASHMQECGQKAPELPSEPELGSFCKIIQAGGARCKSVLFDEDTFDASEAREWMRERGFNNSVPAITSNLLSVNKHIEIGPGVFADFEASSQGEGEKMGVKKTTGDDGQTGTEGNENSGGQETGSAATGVSPEEVARIAEAAATRAVQALKESGEIGGSGGKSGEVDDDDTVDVSQDTATVFELIEDGKEHLLSPEAVEAAQREVGDVVEDYIGDSDA